MKCPSMPDGSIELSFVLQLGRALLVSFRYVTFRFHLRRPTCAERCAVIMVSTLRFPEAVPAVPGYLFLCPPKLDFLPRLQFS